jgi:hypothetical protein
MRRCIPIGLAVLLALPALSGQATIDETKSQAEKAQGGEKARLCAELAEQLVDVVHQQFNKGNTQQAQATVRDILKYAAMARDAAITSHGKMKQTEIVLRETQRRLEALKRTLSVNDRPPLNEVEKSWNNSGKTFWMRCLRRPRRQRNSHSGTVHRGIGFG